MWSIIFRTGHIHDSGVVMGAKASQITSLAIVYSNDYAGADQRKHQSSASLAFVRGNQRWPVNSPHKWPVTRKSFPFDELIMFMWLWKETRLNFLIAWLILLPRDVSKPRDGWYKVSYCFRIRSARLSNLRAIKQFKTQICWTFFI